MPKGEQLSQRTANTSRIDGSGKCVDQLVGGGRVIDPDLQTEGVPRKT
jgi:hypothetical protein